MAKKSKGKKKGKKSRTQKEETEVESTGTPIVGPLISFIVVAIAVAVYFVQHSQGVFRAAVPVIPIDQEKLDAFVAWLGTNHGNNPIAWIDKVDLIESNTPRGRGVHVKRRARMGDPLIQIPMHYVVTIDLGRQSPLGQLVEEEELEDFENLEELYITLFLLQEMRDPNSFWRPYLDVLPQDFSNFPTFFRESELEYIKDTWALYQHEMFNNSAAREFEALQGIESFDWSFEEYSKARTILFSRMSVFQVDVDVYTYGLVPMLDMFNHNTSYPNETLNWLYDQSRNTISVRALELTPRNTEALNNYGRRSIALYLVQYGFTHEDLVDSDRNRALITLDIPEELMNDDFNDTVLSLQVSPNLDHQECIIVFSALRKLTMSAGHKQNDVSLLEATTKTGIEPESTEHELLSVRLFIDEIKKQLALYDTTYEQDMNAYKNAREFGNIRHMILARAAEKKILQEFLDMEDVVRPLLELAIPSDLELTLEEGKAEGKKNYEKYDYYIQNVVLPLVYQKSQKVTSSLDQTNPSGIDLESLKDVKDLGDLADLIGERDTKPAGEPDAKSDGSPDATSADIRGAKSGDAPDVKPADVPDATSADEPDTKSADEPDAKSNGEPDGKSANEPGTKSGESDTKSSESDVKPGGEDTVAKEDGASGDETDTASKQEPDVSDEEYDDAPDIITTEEPGGDEQDTITTDKPGSGDAEPKVESRADDDMYDDEPDIIITDGPRTGAGKSDEQKNK